MNIQLCGSLRERSLAQGAGRLKKDAQGQLLSCCYARAGCFAVSLQWKGVELDLVGHRHRRCATTRPAATGRRVCVVTVDECGRATVQWRVGCSAGMADPQGPGLAAA